MDAIIVTHNSAEDLKGLLACRPLVEAFDTLIVVDNASSDETCAMAAAAGATVVPMGGNRGFGAAANKGSEFARGDVFALLNPDIGFRETNDVATLARLFEDDDTGMVGPSLVLPGGSIQDSARVVPTPFHIAKRRFNEGDRGRVVTAAAEPVPWLVAACLLVRREAFESVGGFDERYFLYFEDVDLCVRMRKEGWAVRYDPAVKVDHYHRAASRAGLLSWATRRHMRSAVRFFCHHPRYAFPWRFFSPAWSARKLLKR